MNMTNGALAGLGILLIFIVLIAIAVGIVFYILNAIGLMTMAKNKGIENAWLAWIPVGNLWIIGKIIGSFELGEKKFDDAAVLMMIATAIVFVGRFIPFIGALISIAFAVFFYMCIYKLYKMYAEESSVLYLVLSIIFSGIAMPIIMFKLRNETPTEIVVE